MTYLGLPIGRPQPTSPDFGQMGRAIGTTQIGPGAPPPGGIGSGVAGIDPAVARGLGAGQKMHWADAQAAMNDATARLGNAYMGEGIPDATMAMPYLRDANEKARRMELARRDRDGEIHRLGMVAADPRGADMYARFEAGELPGYAITGDPSVSPYWKKRVVEQSMSERKDPAIYGRAQLSLASASRVGAPPSATTPEAVDQVMRLADRMTRGRGGAALRGAADQYVAALSGGDPKAVEAARTQLATILGPVLGRFQGRIDKESGAGLVDLEREFFAALDSRVSARARQSQLRDEAAAAANARANGAGPAVPASAAPPGGAGRSGRGSNNRTPTVASNGVEVLEFGSPDQYLEHIDKGGIVRNDQLVVVGGRPYVPAPGADGTQQLVRAIMFGSTVLPHPSTYGGDDGGIRAWSDSLDDSQRRAVLADLTSNPQTRSGLSRKMLDDLDAISRSRQGLLTQQMRPSDRERLAEDLKAREDRALHAAITAIAATTGEANARMTIEEIRQGQLRRQIDDEATKKDAEAIRASGMTPPNYERGKTASGMDAPPDDPLISRTWVALPQPRREFIDSLVATLATEDLAPGPDGKPVAGLLTASEMQRVLVNAQRGATDEELVAMLEKMRPGFARAHYGSSATASSALGDSYAAWTRSAKLHRDDDLMKLHSYCVLFEHTGQWPDQGLQDMWARLPPEARADAASFSRHMRRAQSRASQALPSRQPPSAAPAAAPTAPTTPAAAPAAAPTTPTTPAAAPAAAPTTPAATNAGRPTRYD